MNSMGVGNPLTHILYLENVYKWYGKKLILDNIDIQVTEGEFCTLVGPSGCGKSTLFRIILGEDRATSGTVLVNGKPAGLPDPTCGIVYQKYTLLPHLTALGNAMLAPRLTSGLFRGFLRRKEIVEETMYFLEKVQLADHANQYPHELSGGQQQRVAIAQALIAKPKILLMDEPFAALDPPTREDLQTFLLKLWEEFKMTVLFVTHYVEEAVYLGTRLMVLSQYYTDGRGKNALRGARIMKDYKLDSRACATSVKETAEFGRTVQEVRRYMSRGTYLRRVTAFDLSHPDSFQTLTDEEVREVTE